MNIPWNNKVESAIFCKESLKMLWELEIGNSTKSISTSRNMCEQKYTRNHPNTKQSKDASSFLSLTKNIDFDQTKTEYKHCCSNLMSNECDYVDFSSAAHYFNIEIPDINQYEQIVGERLEAIMLYGGAKRKKDVVLLKDVVDHYALTKGSDRIQRSFVKKLMQLLTDDPNPNIITWLPHGRSFLVLDKECFEKEILPQYFDSTQYKSFQRQLNMWGFQRISGSIDKGAYYHQFFLRGIPALSHLIQRRDSIRFKKTNKSNVVKRKGRPTSTPEFEPDFKKLSKLRPLPI